MKHRPSGTGSIHKLKTGRHWARYRVDGKRVSLGTAATHEGAEALIADMIARIEEGDKLVAAAREPMHVQGFVYIMQEAVEGGAVKIGRAANPARRLLALQTGTPRRLQLLCVVPGGAALEAAMHAAFAAARMNGEWFEPTPQILALAAELRELLGVGA